MNQDKLIFSNRIMRCFTDDSLGIHPSTHSVNSFHFVPALLEAAACNTYIETISNKVDTLYSHIRTALTEMTTYSYLDHIRRLSEKFDWKNKEFVLAFDYTDEDFYGDVQGFNIHGWTKENGVTGKFKFLTCSIISDDIPQKIPLISIPIQLGHYKSYAITHCLFLIKKYIGTIKLILFDRGFYDKSLMYELIKQKYPFLIFVPKAKDKQELLYPLGKGAQVSIIWDYELNKDKTTYRFEACLALMKQIYDEKLDKEYDWVFATNVEDIELSTLIETYKKRWRIEIQFRVQDEAYIKCKSTDMKIRYFLFMFEQMLQTQWVCFYKEEVSFKGFLIGINKQAMELAKKPMVDYGRS